MTALTRKTSAFPLASAAPLSLACTSPDLACVLTTLAGTPVSRSTPRRCSSSGPIRKARSEASSTSRISLRRDRGDRPRTECTVRRRVDQASLWKTMMMEAGGRKGRE